MPTYVVNYPSPNGRVTEGLGISHERFREMTHFLNTLIFGDEAEQSKITLDLVKVGEFCEDMNELCFMSYLYGSMLVKSANDPLMFAVGKAMCKLRAEGKI